MYDPWFELVPGQAEPAFDPARTALLTIDLQHFDAHPDGWMGRVAREKGRPELLEERWQAIKRILPRVRVLQDACRKSNVEVIHIKIGYLTKDCRDGIRSQPTGLIATKANDKDYEFLEEVGPLENEIVIAKTTASAFNSTMIDQVLRNLGVDRLLVTGIVTHGCVELTARDAADRGYDVTVVHDACASSTKELHEAALDRMSTIRLMRIRSADEVLTRLSSAHTVGGSNEYRSKA